MVSATHVRQTKQYFVLFHQIYLVVTLNGRIFAKNKVQLDNFTTMNKYIPRNISKKILEAHKYFPVITITGPRQSGKSTLCKHMFPDYKYLNLENIITRATALTDPVKFIESNGSKLIIDEVQHAPDLLSIIQIKVDEDRSRRYIITGSSNFSLMETMTQSLAGRTAVFTLLPLSLRELNHTQLNCPTEKLIYNGLYPGAISDGIPPEIFFTNYYNTYIERDVYELLKIKNLLTFNTFVRLLAARAGNEINAAALSKEVGVSATTISEWVSILAASYIIYFVSPYYANINKRLTKMPKVYFYDTGLLCGLLGIESPASLLNHNLYGSIFENMVMGELTKELANTNFKHNLNFYREHSGKEVDAIVTKSDGIHLYEIKAGKTIQTGYSKNMDRLEKEIDGVVSKTVIYDGETIGSIAVNFRDIPGMI